MRRPNHRCTARAGAGLVATFLLACGCAHVSVHVDSLEGARPWQPPASVVVLPFANRSEEPTAGEALAQMLAKSLAREGTVRVLALPAELRAAALPIDREQARQAAQAAGAEAALYGTVFTFGYVPDDGRPGARVLADVRLVRTDSAEVTWAARARGDSAPGLFHEAVALTMTADDVAQRLARALVDGD